MILNNRMVEIAYLYLAVLLMITSVFLALFVRIVQRKLSPQASITSPPSSQVPDFRPIPQHLPEEYEKLSPTGFVPVVGGVTQKRQGYEETLYPGNREVVIPGDYYYESSPPSDFGGAYWPSGSIEPDYLKPGDPKRPRLTDRDRFIGV